MNQFTSSFQKLLKQLKLFKENIIPDCFHHDVHQQLVRCCFSLLEETISFWSQLRTSGRLTQESKITITYYLARLTQLIVSITKSWFCLVLGTWYKTLAVPPNRGVLDNPDHPWARRSRLKLRLYTFSYKMVRDIKVPIILCYWSKPRCLEQFSLECRKVIVSALSRYTISLTS